MIQIFKQTTADTCLPSSLIMLLEDRVNISPSQTLELEILVEGDKLLRGNRTLGHLLYVTKKYNVRGIYFVSRTDTFEEACSFLLKKGRDNIEVRQEKINSQFIKQLLTESEVITCIDDYALRKQIHFPHFVVIENIGNNKFSLVDPWEGKRFLLSSTELDDAFRMLDKLNFSRELVQLV